MTGAVSCPVKGEIMGKYFDMLMEDVRMKDFHVQTQAQMRRRKGKARQDIKGERKKKCNSSEKYYPKYSCNLRTCL